MTATRRVRTVRVGLGKRADEPDLEVDHIGRSSDAGVLEHGAVQPKPDG